MIQKKLKEVGKEKDKRFFFNVIEECVMNKDYQMFRCGRIEVFDEQNPSGYAVYEARFKIPEELFSAFREAFDFKTSDYLPCINFDMEDYEKG